METRDAAAANATILVVDDTPDNLALMSSLLTEQYNVLVANNGERALRLAASGKPPDLILLDIMMPGMDGYEVCRRLKADAGTRHIPVIFLTAKATVDDERKGFDLGAADYITKPISPPIVMARVRRELALKASADFLRDQNKYLESEVTRRTRELAAIQDVTIQVMAALAETRDADTGNHIRRTQFYVKALAEQLRDHPRFCAYLSADNITMLYKSAPLHDIGKVGIPDRILLKPGRFDADEFAIMKTHTTLGHKAIELAEKSLDIEVEFLSMAKEIALSHQEKWDGSGYPHGLRGDDIPVSARLMALADVYDAITSRRVYKEGLPHAEALRIIHASNGSHFDPDIVLAFIEIHEQFRDIAARFADSDDNLQQKAADLARASPPDAAE